MEAKKLYLFTDMFPFGPGEKPFVGPEVEHLANHYDVTIISLATDDLAAQEELASPVPDSVNVIRLRRGTRLIRMLRGLSYPFVKACRQEALSILKSGKRRMSRLIDSYVVYCDAKEIQAFLRKRGIFDDASDSVFYSYWTNAAALALAFEKNSDTSLSLITRMHGYDLYNERHPLGRQPFRNLIIKAFRHIIFVADSCKGYFARSFGTAATKDQHQALPVGSWSEYSALARPSSNGGTSIVSCSSIIPLKRVSLIAEALSLADLPNIQWTHFGDGAELDSIREFAAQHELDARFFGSVPNNTVKEYYENNPVDLFITTSQTEGSPVSICEAMSYGIPIIGTAVGGIPEQIDGNGILLPEDPTAEEVAEAIRAIVTMPANERQRLRMRSRELWEERYDQQKNLEALRAILDSA